MKYYLISAKITLAKPIFIAGKETNIIDVTRGLKVEGEITYSIIKTYFEKTFENTVISFALYFPPKEVTENYLNHFFKAEEKK